MKKLLVGMMLAVIPLLGCGAEVEGLAEQGHIVSTEDGTEMVIEHRAEPGEARSEDVSAMGASCWVVLEYCKDPKTGRPNCAQTHCTMDEAVTACRALIRKHC
ncbi:MULTISPECIES: hypothetical protein [unclassified Corallococcus]|uniref:hypothetical protein n=1 Tax=unclassified Corallococcus TaxID=2685029 RepID=UPI001A8C03ED|nr:MULTISPECIES: hypothetical protein [unclassified Corallococcus]MBN9686392.1 hypothetical protein [Corallococcus sp. NCSPR001]WAS82181.1 hypothetical protein O0N60_22950 [Corallococcus sp. NCRR]